MNNDIKQREEDKGPLMGNEIMMIKKVKQQKVWNGAASQATTHFVNKKFLHGKLQMSLANAPTLGDNCYPTTVKKGMTILNSFNTSWPQHQNMALTQIDRKKRGQCRARYTLF